MVNLAEISHRITLYQQTVQMTKDIIQSGPTLSAEFLSLITCALNNIERLAPRYCKWHESTPEKSSKTTV